jgi:hypothetical protein
MKKEILTQCPYFLEAFKKKPKTLQCFLEDVKWAEESIAKQQESFNGTDTPHISEEHQQGADPPEACSTSVLTEQQRHLDGNNTLHQQASLENMETDPPEACSTSTESFRWQ